MTNPKSQTETIQEPELRLAGNHIPGTGLVSWGQGYGHLQFVYVDENGLETELEVQAPDSITFGNWEVPGGELRHERPADGDSSDTYASKTILTGNAATEAHGILNQVRDQIRQKSIDDPDALDYDKDNNSNSFIRTLSDAIGVDLNEHLADVTPTNVKGGYPGAERNIMADPEEVSDIIDFRLHGYGGDNTIMTDLGDNILTGRGGGDILSSGRGSDTLIAAEKIDPYDATAQSRFEARDDGYSPYDDGATDYLNGGADFDSYFVGAARRDSGQNTFLERENGQPTVTEDGFYTVNPGLDIVNDTDGKGQITFSLDGYAATGRNHTGVFNGGTFTKDPNADTVYSRYLGEGELDVLRVEGLDYTNEGGHTSAGEMYVFIDKVNDHPVFAVTHHNGLDLNIELVDAPELDLERTQGEATPTSLDNTQSLRQIVDQLDADLPVVQDRIASHAADGTLTLDETLVGKALSQTGTPQMFADLQAAGVSELDINPANPADPMSRTQAALGAAGDSMRQNNLPAPESEYISARDHTGVSDETVKRSLAEGGEAGNDIIQQGLVEIDLSQTHVAEAQNTESELDYTL